MVGIHFFEELVELGTGDGEAGSSKGGRQLGLVEFPVVIAVDAFEELPELLLGVLDEDSEFWNGTSVWEMGDQRWEAGDTWQRTVILYLTVSTRVNSFENIVKESISVFQSYSLIQLGLSPAVKLSYDGPSSSGPS